MRRNFALIAIAVFFIAAFNTPASAQGATLCIRKSLEFAWVRSGPSPIGSVLATTYPSDCASRPMQWINHNIAWDGTQTWVQVSIQAPDAYRVPDPTQALITGWVEQSSVIDSAGQLLPTPTGLPPTLPASCPRNAAVIGTRYNGTSAQLVWSDGLLTVNNLATGLPVSSYQLEGNGGWLLTVAWSPDGRYLLAASQGGPVQEWDANTGKLLWELPNHPSYSAAIAWSPDGQTFLTAGERVQLWDANKRTLLRVLQDQTGGPAIFSAAWSPDSKLVLIGSYDETAQIFDVNTGKVVQSLPGHIHGVWSAAWSPNGKMLLTTDQDGSIYLWESSTGKLLRSFPGQPNTSGSIAWSPSGDMVLSSDDNFAARLWKPTTGELLYTLHGHKNVIWSVSWSPDGKTAITGSLDGVALLWDMSTGKLLRPLCGQ